MTSSYRGSSPYSQEFDDIYFNPKDGLAESAYVFLQQSGLLKRLEEDKAITVGELGFGTGLNFLTVWDAWKKARSNQILHFISFEKYPLPKHTLEGLKENFSPFSESFDQLLSAYPENIQGFHHRQFEEGKVQLTLVNGDILWGLDQLVGSVDVWFLDGFAPAKNPEMWKPEVFNLMAAKSCKGTTFSTFTAAAQVRRDLTAAGFVCKKVKGFAYKREMLCGEFMGSLETKNSLPSQFSFPLALKQEAEIAIIGAGVAGISCAYQLQLAGYAVSVFDEEGVAAKASGNPMGIIQPYLTGNFSGGDQFVFQGFSLTKQIVQKYSDVPQNFSGLVQLITKDHLKRKLASLKKKSWPESVVRVLSEDETSEYLGFTKKEESIFYPGAGVFSPKSWLDLLVKNFSLSVQSGQKVTKIEKKSDAWALYAGNNSLGEFDAVFLCQGSSLHDLYGKDLVKRRPGQITVLESNELSKKLPRTVCYDGYITPVFDENKQLVGASYRHDSSESEEVRIDDDKDNLKRLALATDLKDFKVLESRASSRATTKNHLPLVGPLLEEAVFTRKISPRDIFSYDHGLFISCGHGSKGLHTALLSASTLVHLLLGKALPISRDSYLSIHPSRFLQKK